MSKKWTGKKVKIIDNLEDHVGYEGQELLITKVLEDDYVMVSDGKKTWYTGIEETDYFKYEKL